MGAGRGGGEKAISMGDGTLSGSALRPLPYGSPAPWDGSWAKYWIFKAMG